MMTIQSITPSVLRDHDNLEQLNALLNKYCLSLTGSEWDSDDLVQDTWIKLLEKIKDRQHNNPEALLLRTAKNTWIDRVRRRKVFERILDKEREQAKENGEGIKDSSSLNMEMAFHFLIQYLSPLQRTVLLMRSVLGYSVAEAAVKLQTTEGAVKAAYHRARKELQTIDQDSADFVSNPLEEETKTRLSALAAAYENGEVEVVLRLVQEDQEEQEMVSAVGFSAHTRLVLPSQGPVSQYGIRMAA